MSSPQSDFNYRHSSTQITVERTIGMLKNRFRVLKLPLNQKPDQVTGRSAESQMGRLMEACFVLHNLFLDFKDDVDVSVGRNTAKVERLDLDAQQAGADAISPRDSIAEYLHINRVLFKAL